MGNPFYCGSFLIYLQRFSSLNVFFLCMTAIGWWVVFLSKTSMCKQNYDLKSTRDYILKCLLFLRKYSFKIILFVFKLYLFMEQTTINYCLAPIHIGVFLNNISHNIIYLTDASHELLFF